MAPAARALQSTIITSTLTKLIHVDFTPRPMVALEVSKRTTTITVTSTITVDAPSTTSTQFYQDPPITNNKAANRIDKFLIHGIVLGNRPPAHPASLSPLLHHAGPHIRSTTILSSSHILPHTCSPTCSNFPRPSPPGFLYPEPMVPPTVPGAQDTSTMQAHEHAYHPTISDSADYKLAGLSPGLKILLLITLATITLASCWAVLVVLVNFPPGTWGIWKYWAKERRPIDKPSKYTHSDKGRVRSESATEQTSGQHRRQIQSANSAHETEQGIELQQRPQHRFPDHRRSIPSQRRSAKHEAYTEHRRTSSSSLSATPRVTPITQSTPPSPPNPFLRPPNTQARFLTPGAHIKEPIITRTSSEWIADRATFFSSQSPPPSSYPHTPSSSHPSTHSPPNPSSPPSDTYSLDISDIEALEAGTAPLTGHKRSTSSESGASENGALKRSLSWLDQGLGMMDEGVTRVAGGIAKWTDDEGGDEGLLLPLAREKRKTE
ncbi:hypothetical protein J1614_000619 [Plenodomus biglobosus]|nr:hypothetical protein J1614_000619 [Plenodomus biglobosus]